MSEAKSSEAGSESPVSAFFGAVKERLSHPVAGIYPLFWLIVNWKFAVYLWTADSPGSYRIEEAVTYLTPWGSMLWPALWTALYLALAPGAKLGIDLFNDWVDSVRTRVTGARDLASLSARRAYVRARAMEEEKELKDLIDENTKLEARLKVTKDEADRLGAAIGMLSLGNDNNWLMALNRLESSADKTRSQQQFAEEFNARIKQLAELRKHLAERSPGIGKLLHRVSMENG